MRLGGHTGYGAAFAFIDLRMVACSEGTKPESRYW
jgi:hypothetical protein